MLELGYNKQRRLAAAKCANLSSPGVWASFGDAKRTLRAHLGGWRAGMSMHEKINWRGGECRVLSTMPYKRVAIGRHDSSWDWDRT